jgi:hypothetical protein
MPGLNRRTFLSRGSLALAAGGVATVPGLGSILQAGSAEAPELEGAATESEAAAAEAGSPLIAHVTDLRAGQISVFQGEREVVIQNRSLAAQLYRMSR